MDYRQMITLDDLKDYEVEPDESPHIKPAMDYADEVVERFHNPKAMSGSRLPWGKAEFAIQFRGGEVSLWLGMNGHGKSMLLGQLMTCFMAQGDKACILSFEMKPVATLQRMCRQAAMTSQPSIEYIRKFHDWTDGKLWMYDQQGTVSTKRVLSVLRYFADKLKGNHVVIDSLMKCGINEDDYNGQKRFVDELTAIARDKNIHIHLVHHSRKLGDERNPPGKMDAKGSGAITDQVDNCITVWRNKENEDKADDVTRKPDALMVVDKQRHGEWEGRIGLWFHKDSQQYMAAAGLHPQNLCVWRR
jgi:twinkle protein